MEQLEQVNEAIMRGDLDSLITHDAEDVHFETRGAVIDGRRAFRDHFANVLSGVSDLKVTTTWACAAVVEVELAPARVG